MKEPTGGQQLSLLDLMMESQVDHLLSVDEIFATGNSELFARLPEDQRFERKSAKVDPAALADYLSAFGNGPSVSGGVVVIGIADDCSIEGCKSISPLRLNEIENMGHDRCPYGRFEVRRVPAVNRLGEQDFVVVVRVRYVEDRLVELTNGNALIRLSGKNKALKEFERQEYRINKGEISFEQQQCNLTWPEDFRTNDVSRFLRQLRGDRLVSDETSDEQLLEMMHLGRRKNDDFIPNNAFALLFARDPLREFPGSRIHFLRYEGEEEGSGSEYNVVKDRMFDGTILDQIKECAQFIENQLRDFTALGPDGKFYTVAEYPRDAWYELIVNACVHRSYHIRTAPIFVKMFDSRLVVESPGGFMPQVTPETIYEMHRPRNPFIMLVLREFGEVRCINEGTKRIRKEMAGAHLPAPLFAQEEKGQICVRATLKNDIHNRKNALDSEAYRQLGEAISLSLSDDERKIINYVIEHGGINVSETLRIVKSTRWHTAKAMLERLVDRNALEFFHNGTDRDPHSRYFLPGTIRREAYESLIRMGIDPEDFFKNLKIRNSTPSKDQ